MIYIDSNEALNQSLLPALPDAVELPNLESITGADIMLTLEPFPAATETLIQRHIDLGAILFQRKSGLDLAASVGERMNDSLARMKSLKAKSWQSLLLFIGVLTERKDGHGLIDGRDTGKTFAQIKSAEMAWSLRGGTFIDLSRASQLEPFLKSLEVKLQHMKENPTKEVWHSLHIPIDSNDPAQLLEPIPRSDGRYLLVAIDGIGPKMIKALWKQFGNAAEILCWLSNPDSNTKLVHGVGPKTIERTRKQLGLDEVMELDLQVMPKYTQNEMSVEKNQ